MKKVSKVMVTGIFLVLISIHAFSQNELEPKALPIEPYHLEIGFYKTTNLVFPYAIKSVDRGSKDVLAQKATGVENILQVKAGKANFEETNLTVITVDGKLYSYLINYDSNPSVLNIQFASTDNINTNALFSPATSNEAAIVFNAKKVSGKKRTLYGRQDSKYRIRLSLIGLFIQDNIMYYQVKIENFSRINYDIDQFRFFIRDLKKSKRTAFQELELKPLCVFNNTDKIFNASEQVIVFALSKFTIPDKKYLTIQLMEKDGGRHLNMSLKNKDIMNLKLIN